MNNLNFSVIKAPGIAMAGSLLLALPVFANGNQDHGNGHRGGQGFMQQQNQAARLAGLRNRSQFINNAGQVQPAFRGIALDLNSTERSIVLGERLFRGANSYTINAGGEARVLAAGNRVSAAEYVALQQVIAGGAQGLVVDGTGRGVEGNFDLNSINDGGTRLRAASLVVPENVTAIGDFSKRADGLRVTNDLVNQGSIYAYTTQGRNNTVRISAREIENGINGVISTDFPLTFAENNNSTNLSLRAERNISNSGAIISAGDLDLTSGGALNNAASGNILADGNINLNTSSVSNKGTIASGNGNVNFNGAGASELQVNNTGGTISAASGAINIRFEAYNGTGNSTVVGGDLLSRELNLFTGLGTTDVQVDELTGVLYSSGSAAHVSSNTNTLTIGEQCLVGDPTYFNTGDIILAGNIDVGEDLAIIAGGSITTTAATLLIRARDTALSTGADIVMVAGATVSGGPGQVPPAGGPAVLIAQGPVFTDFATGPVTVSVTTGGGGDIDLTGATTSLLIDTTPSIANAFGGNITLAAFQYSGNGGRVLLPTTSNINSSGSGTAHNGNVSIFAGAPVGTAIVLGDINARGGSGTANGTGDVVIANENARSTDGLPVTFGTDGKITSLNFFVLPLFFVGNADVSVQNINAAGSVDVIGGALTQIGSINASGTTAADNGGRVGIRSLSSNIVVNGVINANGGASASGGTVDINTNSLAQTVLNGITATGGTGDGGTIAISNTFAGGVLLSSGSYLVSGANGGNIDIKTGGVFNFDQAILDAGSLGLAGNNGTISINSESIEGTSTGQLQMLSNNGDGGGVFVGATNGGVVTMGGSFEIRSRGSISLDLANNSISADGAPGFAGGSIVLDAPTINYASSSTNPLVLTANGDKASAGAINYSSESLVPTFIGTPAKLPKGEANFLSVGANGGTTTGDAGTLIVAVGGNLTVQSNTIDLAPGPGGGIGATILFTAAGLLPKGGSLIINGDLSADSTGGLLGGSIALFGNSKKTFVVGAKKTPKNGVFGELSANGLASGSISIINGSGGIQVANSSAVSAFDISLNAAGKGRVYQSKNVLTTAGNQVTASADEGDIILLVSSSVISAFSNFGKVKITDTTLADTTLLDSFSGDDFEINTAGALAVGNISVSDGNIELVTGESSGGPLQISGLLEAFNGGIVIQNSDVDFGSIDIVSGSTIQTQGKGKNVVIAIGPAPKKGTNPSPPFAPGAAFTINNVGKGMTFFGENPNDITAVSVTLNSINKNVILNNGSNNPGTNKIAFGNAVTVTADPPSPPPRLFSIDSITFEPTLTNSSVDSSIGSSAKAGTVFGASQVQSSMALPTDILGSAKVNGLSNAESVLEQFATMPAATTTANVSATIAGNSATITGNSATMSGNCSTGTGTLRKGVLFAPSKRTEIETPFGKVTIERGGIAFVINDGNKLAVYDLHDSNRGAISVSTSSAKHILQPGGCIVFTDRVHHQFEHANPVRTIGYRSLTAGVANGVKMFKGEFSIVSAINSITPLQAAVSGKDHSAKQLRNRLLKTTAVLMHLDHARDSFRAYAEPEVTAMR